MCFFFRLDMDARAPLSGQERSKGEEQLHRSPSSKPAGTNWAIKKDDYPKPNAITVVKSHLASLNIKKNIEQTKVLAQPLTQNLEKPWFWRSPRSKTKEKPWFGQCPRRKTLKNPWFWRSSRTKPPPGSQLPAGSPIANPSF